MKDRVFNTDSVPWMNSKFGKSKVLLSRSVLGSSSIRIHCLPGKSEYEAHEHSFTQVMYFKKFSNAIIILDDDRKYKIVEGLIVVVKPNQCHKIINNSEDSLEILVIESYDAPVHNNPFVDF